MLRNLQTNENSASNGQNTSTVDMVRGTFVTLDEATKTFSPATGIAGVKMIDRGTKNTISVSQGFAISPYDTDQDTILAGERGYAVDLEGRWATTQYDSTVNASLAVGSYLTISAGKLIASPSNAVTIIKFIGLVPDCGHTLAGFEINLTSKLV